MYNVAMYIIRWVWNKIFMKRSCSWDFPPADLHWFFEISIRIENKIQWELKKKSVGLFWNLVSVLTEYFFFSSNLELKKNSVRTEIKFQLVYNWIFIPVWNECRNEYFKKPVEINMGFIWFADSFHLVHRLIFKSKR